MDTGEKGKTYTLKMEINSLIHYPNNFSSKAKYWLDIQVLKVRYYSFLF